jgi:2'-5' RNA ligase
MHIRAFVAANLDQESIARVQAVQRQLDKCLPPNLVRWTRPDQLHLTLRFLGNVAVEQVEALKAALTPASAVTGPLQLALAGLGCFPSPQRPSVIWLGLEGDVQGLARLQARIEGDIGEFGSHSEDRAFKAHLTIGRVKGFGPQVRPIGEVIQTQTIGTLTRWTLREVTLMRSQLSPKGSTYTELSRVPLVGPGPGS